MARGATQAWMWSKVVWNRRLRRLPALEYTQGFAVVWLAAHVSWPFGVLSRAQSRVLRRRSSRTAVGLGHCHGPRDHAGRHERRRGGAHRRHRARRERRRSGAHRRHRARRARRRTARRHRRVEVRVEKERGRGRRCSKLLSAEQLRAEQLLRARKARCRGAEGRRRQLWSLVDEVAPATFLAPQLCR